MFKGSETDKDDGLNDQDNNEAVSAMVLPSQGTHRHSEHLLVSLSLLHEVYKQCQSERRVAQNNREYNNMRNMKPLDTMNKAAGG